MYIILIVIIFFIQCLSEVLGPDCISYSFAARDWGRVELAQIGAVVHDIVAVVLVLFNRISVEGQALQVGKRLEFLELRQTGQLVGMQVDGGHVRESCRNVLSAAQ